MNIYEHPFKSANFSTTNYVMHPWSYSVPGALQIFYMIIMIHIIHYCFVALLYTVHCIISDVMGALRFKKYLIVPVRYFIFYTRNQRL